MPKKKTSMPPLLIHGAAAPEDGDDRDHEDPKSSSPLKCLTPLSLLRHHDCSRRADKISGAYGQWRAEQRASAERMERQLRSRRTLGELIDDHLARFGAHYNRTGIPLRPRDVGRLLDPPWNPPLANAALSWLGDWRPSAILALIPTLSSYATAPSSLSDLCPRAHRAIAEAIRRLKIQEAVLDQEVEEWQATAALRMALGKGVVAEEVAKMEGVVARAQRLRYKALELAVKSVLDRLQAAEFLVALSGVQELVHQHAERWRLRIGPVSVAVQGIPATR